jgi:hypothetical protein
MVDGSVPPMRTREQYLSDRLPVTFFSPQGSTPPAGGELQVVLRLPPGCDLGHHPLSYPNGLLRVKPSGFLREVTLESIARSLAQVNPVSFR